MRGGSAWETRERLRVALDQRNETEAVFFVSVAFVLAGVVVCLACFGYRYSTVAGPACSEGGRKVYARS